MQGQYGASTDKRLRVVMGEMWAQWGFRRGIMRGYWVSLFPFASLWPPPVVYLFNNRRAILISKSRSQSHVKSLPMPGTSCISSRLLHALLNCGVLKIKIKMGSDSTPVRHFYFSFVNNTILLIPRTILLTAFEFSKREFNKVYGPQLPIWALLASGSTGGVRAIPHPPSFP
jgi:hypothetical protein